MQTRSLLLHSASTLPAQRGSSPLPAFETSQIHQMSSQPSSESSRPTGRPSYLQLHPEDFHNPDPDTSGDINAAIPSSPPTPEPQHNTRTQRPRPHIFKSKPFSQIEVQGPKRPARPTGHKPKPLHALEITDLYPDDDSIISATLSLHDTAPRDAATRKSSERNAPPHTLNPTNPIPLSPNFFEEHSRFLLNEDSLGISSSSSSSYHLPPFPAALNHHQHILPLHSPSTPSLSPSEHHLLRPQRFLSFLMEYTTSFVNYVFDINMSHRGRYGLGRSRTSRDTRYYGERETDRGTQTQRNRERGRGRT